jgi:hypothetical protein
LDLLQQHNGRLRVDWSLGVGKSHNIDLVIEEAITSGAYGLVISLFPTRQVIEERKWVMNPPEKFRVINLKPRPKSRCGTAMNRRWLEFEKKGMGTFGRISLCGHCSSRSECPWPSQFGKSLRGAQVIFGTQAHLERTPHFLDQLAQWVQAEKVLVILDEANFIMKPFKRKIDRRKLEIFLDVLEKLHSKNRQKSHVRWIYLSRLLLDAQTSGLSLYTQQ